MLSEKCFVVFYVSSFPPGTLNLIASIPGTSIFFFTSNDIITTEIVSSLHTTVYKAIRVISVS